MRLNSLIILILVIGSLISSLLYLSVPNEIKYSKETAFYFLDREVINISAYSAWFFSEYLAFGIIQLLSISGYKEPLVIYMIRIHSLALCIRGAVYILMYLEVLPDQNQHRLAYLLSYVFLLSLVALFNYNLTPKETYD